MVSLRVITRISLYLCVSSIAHGVAGYSDWVGLSAIEIAAPRCEGVAELSASSDYFVEIANEVPGKDEYNELIRFYETKNWSQFEEKMEIFKKAFETSPLREAASFLDTEAAVAQAEVGDDTSIKLAEKKVREVLLLFPKSKLVPVTVVSAANLALKNKNYNKSLALFESARVDYPFHELSCRFLVGVAECQFHIQDERASTAAFKSVLQKCSDPVSKVIADIRLADMGIRTNYKKSLATYSQYAEKFPIRLAKISPWAMFNAGEAKYKDREYASAKYYFTEFVKYGKKSDCLGWAMKRVADIQVKQGRAKEEGVGAHYAVFDKYPNSDIGKFSRLHGFLIELDKLPSAEVDRRLKLFDAEIEKIMDQDLRSMLFFEKGLALLGLNEKSALSYLVRFNERKEGILSDKSMGKYVRGKILTLLENELAENAKKTSLSNPQSDSKLFEPLEDAYAIWFKGSTHEQKARVLYQKLILSRMKRLLEQDNLGAAVSRLDRWSNSGIWPSSGPPREAHAHVASALLRYLHFADADQKKTYATAVVEHESSLKPFLTGELESVWIAVFLALGNREKVDALMKSRQIASAQTGGYSPELRSQLLLTKGRAARFLRQYDKANGLLRSVDYPSLKVEANIEQFEIAKEMEKPESMLSVASRVRTHTTPETFLKMLESIADILIVKKTWALVPTLQQLAENSNIGKKNMGPFLSLKGRALYEKGSFLKAIDAYETAITISPELGKSADLKFRLGKAYFKTKQKERARKQWEELVDLKDETWSPLASNELKLLDGK